MGVLLEIRLNMFLLFMWCGCDCGCVWFCSLLVRYWLVNLMFGRLVDCCGLCVCLLLGIALLLILLVGLFVFKILLWFVAYVLVLVWICLLHGCLWFFTFGYCWLFTGV